MKIQISQPHAIMELGMRTNQEDSLFPFPLATEHDKLFVLCDGMGGHEHGEVASQLVCDVMSECILNHYKEGVLMDYVIQNALNEVFCRINKFDNGSSRQMGSTMTLLCLHQGGAVMAHIGDSRIYHVRPSEKRILYKSRDHSLAYDMYMAGELSFNEIGNYKKNVITRAITPGLERHPKIDIAHTTDIKTGDCFFLCSDGMLENMKDAELIKMLSSQKTIQEMGEEFRRRTENNQDNHSAWIITIDSVVKEEDDEKYVNDEQTIRSNSLLWEPKEKTPWYMQLSFVKYLCRG